MAGASFTLTGDKRLAAQFDALSDAARGQAMAAAAKAGALPILNEWKARSPVETGTYRRSQHIGEPEVGANSAEVKVGSNVEYGPRLELGFIGTDALGRTYHQPARPDLRNALESQRGAAEREVADALRGLLRAAV